MLEPPHLISDCIPYMPGILTMSGEQDAPPCAGMGNVPHSSISSAPFLLGPFCVLLQENSAENSK